MARPRRLPQKQLDAMWEKFTDRMEPSPWRHSASTTASRTVRENKEYHTPEPQEDE